MVRRIGLRTAQPKNVAFGGQATEKGRRECCRGGRKELDTGDVARRLGDELLFQNLAERNINYLNSLSFKRLLTIDPHAYHAIGQEYRALGGEFEVVHHTQLLNELLTRGDLSITKAVNRGRVTYHDPCYLGRYNGEVEAPRALIAALSGEFVEMERSGMNSRCCGGVAVLPLAMSPASAECPTSE